jgi:hypothetical protein
MHILVAKVLRSETILNLLERTLDFTLDFFATKAATMKKLDAFFGPVVYCMVAVTGKFLNKESIITMDCKTGCRNIFQ